MAERRYLLTARAIVKSFGPTTAIRMALWALPICLRRTHKL
ncbi:hypothetical protein B0G75_101973 [Paraburkholderia sp. BL18I3N2]|nr:hypothetical protein B0G75_101973 [Paraburkholderia sp. BL18I3N2]